jgi:hypothetical protein
VVCGILGFLLATVFPVMLRAALPNMTEYVFVGLWAGFVALPLSGFAHVFRNGKGLDTRCFASCGIVVILTLFAGELTGTISLYPWHTSFFIVPGPVSR